MRSKPIKIAIIGDFSSGKSSLINWLLNCYILDVDIKPTTARIYEISFSYTPKEDVIKENGIEIHKISYPFPTLRNLQNITLIDTPGFNSSNLNHLKHSEYAIEIADAIILVIDVSTGTIKKSILDRIKKINRKPIAILISKIDKTSSSNINLVKAKIKQELEKIFANIVFIGKTTIINNNGAKDFLNAIKLISEKLNQ